MSARTGAKKRGVYEFIWELIREGFDAHLVNHKGLFELNWPVVARRYFDHQASKNPKRTKQFDPKSASNGLRAALLNFYKKEGASEIKQARKFGDNNEVVWRRFQMPHRIYCELTGSSGQTQREETSSDDSMFEDVIESGAASSPQSAVCVDDSASHTSTDTSGFFETTDIAGTPEFSWGSDIAAAHSKLFNPNHSSGSDIEPLCPENDCEPCDLFSSLSEMSEAEFQLALNDVTSSDIEALDLESKEKNLVSEIFPCRDSIKGGIRFSVTLAESLPPTVSSIVAYFGEIGPVDLEKKNEFTICGTVPCAPKAGTVVVAILTDGKYIGDAEFVYVNPMEDFIKSLVQNPMYLDMWAVQQLGTQPRWLDITDVLKLAQPVNGQPDEGPASHTQLVESVDVLQLMVYTAAKIDAQQFMRVLFSTSVGRVVFNHYRDKATLPPDVARANGHEELAQYLEEVHQKLQDADDQVDGINWQELRHAVKTLWDTTGSSMSAKEEEVDGLSNCSDHGTDYDADSESSSSLLSDASSAAESTCQDLQPNASCSVGKLHQPPGEIGRSVNAGKDVLERMTSSHCKMTCADSKLESPTLQCRSPSGKKGWEDVQCAADQCSGPNAEQPASFMHECRGENKQQDNHKGGQMRAEDVAPQDEFPDTSATEEKESIYKHHLVYDPGVFLICTYWTAAKVVTVPEALFDISATARLSKSYHLSRVIKQKLEPSSQTPITFVPVLNAPIRDLAPQMSTVPPLLQRVMRSILNREHSQLRYESSLQTLITSVPVLNARIRDLALQMRPMPPLPQRVMRSMLNREHSQLRYEPSLQTLITSVPVLNERVWDLAPQMRHMTELLQLSGRIMLNRDRFQLRYEPILQTRITSVPVLNAFIRDLALQMHPMPPVPQRVMRSMLNHGRSQLRYEPSFQTQITLPFVDFRTESPSTSAIASKGSIRVYSLHCGENLVRELVALVYRNRVNAAKLDETLSTEPGVLRGICNRLNVIPNREPAPYPIAVMPSAQHEDCVFFFVWDSAPQPEDAGREGSPERYVYNHTDPIGFRVHYNKEEECPVPTAESAWQSKNKTTKNM